jgi:hypothetical protein
MTIRPSHPFHWLSLPPRLRGKTNVSASINKEEEKTEKYDLKYST